MKKSAAYTWTFTVHYMPNKNFQQKMPHMPGKNVVQCPHCGASQKVKNATKNITARLCADLNGQEVWFTAFRDTIEAFLSKKNLTKAAKSDEISYV